MPPASSTSTTRGFKFNSAALPSAPAMIALALSREIATMIRFLHANARRVLGPAAQVNPQRQSLYPTRRTTARKAPPLIQCLDHFWREGAAFVRHHQKP